ncbi:response regulator [Candidatus Poribacteria bacterium]|nr:response regulator [Candidatus Poribacteria bacterium]
MTKNRILLVDDEPDIVETAAFMLQSYSFQVITAGNGIECIEKAKKEQPDLILLDIMMPEMNGYEVCAKLREDDSTKHIPIIMLSAKGESEAILKSHKIGADDYVVKPFSMPTLLSKLEKVLEE